MRMQMKLTLVFLLTGMVSACTVGGVAYWLETREFRESIMEEAFLNFQDDLRAYLVTYGDYQTAKGREPFTRFVQRRRNFLQSQDFSEPSARAPISGNTFSAPPFHFLVMTPGGIVQSEFEEYPVGTKAPDQIIEKAVPVTMGGRVVVLAYPIGRPSLTPRHRNFLIAMRHSIGTGIAVAAAMAVVLGVFLGKRLSRSLVALTEAIRTMGRDREEQLYVDVASTDELGELAGAFNEMNKELTNAHKELRELSIRDELTSLYNRRHFDEQARMLYEQAIRYQRPLSVMIGDLDHFKRINDTFSHQVGDMVLRKVSEILIQETRKSDVVARYGGEEFVVIFPDSGLIEAAGRCDQIRRTIEEAGWDDIQPGLKVTVSMGLCGDLTAPSAEAMIKLADNKLYQAKEQGRNQVVY